MLRWSVVLAVTLVLTGCVTNSGGYYPSSGYSSGYGHGYGHGYRHSATLSITDANYTEPGNLRCDPMREVRRACDGERSCRVEAMHWACTSYNKPRAKALVVGYSCGHGRQEVRIPERGTVTLTCR